jgi:hypothetical protein
MKYLVFVKILILVVFIQSGNSQSRNIKCEVVYIHRYDSSFVKLGVMDFDFAKNIDIQRFFRTPKSKLAISIRLKNDETLNDQLKLSIYVSKKAIDFSKNNDSIFEKVLSSSSTNILSSNISGTNLMNQVFSKDYPETTGVICKNN